MLLGGAGEQWRLRVQPEGEKGSFIRVLGVSIDLYDERVALKVDVAFPRLRGRRKDLRALRERIVREFPKRYLSTEEAANEVLGVVEEMQGMLESAWEVSDALDVREEIQRGPCGA